MIAPPWTVVFVVPDEPEALVVWPLTMSWPAAEALKEHLAEAFGLEAEPVIALADGVHLPGLARR